MNSNSSALQFLMSVHDAVPRVSRTIVGVLVEVPVMLILVKIANATRGKFKPSYGDAGK